MLQPVRGVIGAQWLVGKLARGWRDAAHKAPHARCRARQEPPASPAQGQGGPLHDAPLKGTGWVQAQTVPTWRAGLTLWPRPQGIPVRHRAQAPRGKETLQERSITHPSTCPPPKPFSLPGVSPGAAFPPRFPMETDRAVQRPAAPGSGWRHCPGSQAGQIWRGSGFVSQHARSSLAWLLQTD